MMIGIGDEGAILFGIKKPQLKLRLTLRVANSHSAALSMATLFVSLMRPMFPRDYRRILRPSKHE